MRLEPCPVSVPNSALFKLVYCFSRLIGGVFPCLASLRRFGLLFNASHGRAHNNSRRVHLLLNLFQQRPRHAARFPMRARRQQPDGMAGMRQPWRQAKRLAIIIYFRFFPSKGFETKLQQLPKSPCQLDSAPLSFPAAPGLPVLNRAAARAAQAF